MKHLLSKPLKASNQRQEKVHAYAYEGLCWWSACWTCTASIGCYIGIYF